MEIENIASINNAITYLIIYSFLGWILESLYKTVRTKKLVNSGFLYGPICPIYGFGAIIMLLLLRHFKNNAILLFVIGFFALSIWEYFVGFLLEKIFKTKYWDYSKYKFNINGRVCLLNSFFWGVLSVVFIKLIHPPFQNLMDIINKEVQIYANIILIVLILIDFIISVIKVYNINLNEYSLQDVAKNIKLQLEKIKQYAGTKAKESDTLEKMQAVLDELRQRQDVLKEKIDKQTQRLRRAFPTMKSQISEKIDSIRRKK